MIELKNISVKEYFELNTELKSQYDFAIKYAKFFQDSRDIFETGDFTQKEFGFIKDLQQVDWDKVDWEYFLDLIHEITGKEIKHIAAYSLLEVLQFKNYIFSEVVRINRIENELLSHSPTSDEKNAGIEKFEVFGSYPQIRQIATTFNITIDEARKIKYTDCLTELYYQKTTSDFQNAMNKIISNKK
jgi:hypothetical protein